MIVQACLNGARPADFHAALPLTAEAMARDAVAALSEGAAELHIHPRDREGKESLAAVSETVRLVRQACPGTFIGVSTGAWIENDVQRTRQAIAGWTDLPDYASVNLSEDDAPAVIDLLAKIGVGIEAGLATLDDVERFAALEIRNRVLRVLIEVGEPDTDAALALGMAMLHDLESAGIRRPVLFHGFNGTIWPFVHRAAELGLSTRIGLEDGRELPDGSLARDNADMVRAAVAITRAARQTG